MAEQKEPDFIIYLTNCNKILTPMILGHETEVLTKAGEKKFYCNKYDSLYLCNIQDGNQFLEKMFTIKPSKDKSEIKMNNDNDKENIIIRDRMVFYNYLNIEKSFVYNETCQGYYTTKEQRAQMRLYDLNAGLKDIFKKMDAGKKDE